MILGDYPSFQTHGNVTCLLQNPVSHVVTGIQLLLAGAGAAGPRARAQFLH